MAFQVNSEVYCNYIRDRLTDLVGTVRRENCLNLQALNIHAEQFYTEFLNLLFDWQLGNANALRQNAKGIDLIDEENHIVVQVSSDKTLDKVQKSLKKSEQYQGCHFYFVAIAEKVSFRQGGQFQVPLGLIFDPIDDIFSVTKLEEKVRYTVIEKQKALYELMRRHFSAQQEESDGISSALRASLEAVLEKVREDHPSFWLMKPDEIDHRLIPDGVEVQPFTAQGTQAGDDTPRPVWDRIAESWQGEKNRAIVIEGEGGIGKTVTLLSPPEALPVPAIYIHLYELVKDGKCLSISDWLDAKMKGWAKEIDALAMGEWKNGPSLMLLCDGVNEVPVVKRRDILNQLTDWNSSHPGAQLIVVSRPLDESSLQGNLSEAVHIKLKPLSKDTAISYLREVGQEAPDVASPVWAVLCRPLFLILYAKTGKIAQSEAEGYPLAFKEAKGPGAIIWNYLQREVLRYPDAEWVLRCAVACEYILPAIAYDMLVRHAFTISMDRAETLITETLEKFDENRLPRHLASLWRKHKRVHRKNPDLRSFDWEATVLDDTCLLLLLPEQEGELEDVYNFTHQNFRDCLAGVYLVNQAEMAGDDELPEVWKHGQNHLALDYAAELMDAKTADKLWEINRKMQQYKQAGYEKNHTVTCSLLELEKRRNPKPEELNFSGMDLCGLSLTRYMGQGDTDLTLFRKASLTQGTKLDRATFQSEGHIDWVTCMVPLPDGRVVSGSSDHTLRVWDTTTGQCLQTLDYWHRDKINCVSILPDGWVVSGSDDHTLNVWDTTSGKCLQTLWGHDERISCVAVFPDGRVVSGSDDSTLRVWDTALGKCLHTLKGHEERITCVAALPDGRVVSGSDDSTLRVWDTASGKCLQALKGHEHAINCVAVLPNGHIVSCSDDRTLRVWNVATGHCLQTLCGHMVGIHCLAVFPDGRVVSCSDDHTLRVWDTTSGKCLQTIETYTDTINCIAVHPDGSVVTASDDCTVRVWSIDGSYCTQILEGHTEKIICVAILPDGRIVSGSSDCTLRVWDSITGQSLQTLKGHHTWKINCMTVLTDGKVVGGLDDGTLRVWEPTSGRCLKSLKEHSGRINCMVVLKDGRIVSGSNDRSVRIWEVDKGECLQILKEHYMPTCMTLLPDVWDINMGKCLQTMKGHMDGVNCVAVLSNKQVISGSKDGTLRVWDVDTGECLDVLESTEVDVSKMDFSQACLMEDLAKLLWQNRSTISQADYDCWVKPN